MRLDFNKLDYSNIDAETFKKANFVKEFGELCKKYKICGVDHMEYVIGKIYHCGFPVGNENSETVIVAYNESGSLNHLVDVNGDSPLGILLDVSKHIE